MSSLSERRNLITRQNKQCPLHQPVITTSQPDQSLTRPTNPISELFCGSTMPSHAQSKTKLAHDCARCLDGKHQRACKLYQNRNCNRTCKLYLGPSGFGKDRSQYLK